jgi:hypothetical protein
MRTGKEFLETCAEAAGITLGNQIPATVFAELGLPLIVACTCCGMTMCFPSCVIDDDNYVYCSDCGGG